MTKLDISSVNNQFSDDDINMDLEASNYVTDGEVCQQQSYSNYSNSQLKRVAVWVCGNVHDCRA